MFTWWMFGVGPGSTVQSIVPVRPCAVVGIAPIYLGTYRCVGMGYFGGWKRRT